MFFLLSPYAFRLPPFLILMRTKLAVILIAILLLSSTACRDRNSNKTKNQLPPAAPLPDDTKVAEESIRFLEKRVQNDPDDMISYNMLASRYLQRLRETGNINYLDLAIKAVHASLKVLPQDRNLNALSLLADIDYVSHDFSGARDHAKELIALDPSKVFPYQVMGDALIELGDYDRGANIYKKMLRLNDNSTNSRTAIETRFARLETLYGNLDKARDHYLTALEIAARITPTPPRELTAWCRWQLGETAFAKGDYETAERHYNDALTTFPDYFRALASLARVKAALGDLAGAIKQYEYAVKVLPDPTFVAALGDLYKLTGKEKEAKAQYALVEQIAKLSELSGTLYNRNIALFYADHDIKTEEAYADAEKEYQARRDIYGADAVAWTALKAGKLAEAQTAMKEALKLGTQDAKLFYHAGMIARAAGDKAAARDLLQRALKLNPQFDPLQAAIASKALAE
jgi:tetratricopeptide (TPR) repeat protein